MNLATRCGVQNSARAAAVKALLAQIQSLGLTQLRVVWCDLHGSLRSKTLVCGTDDLSALVEVLDNGLGMVSTLLLKDSADQTAVPVFEPGALRGLPGVGAANNMLLLPDPHSLKTLPWAPATGWLRAQPFWADGSSVAVCPRTVLQCVLGDLADQGFVLRCGLEVEFHIHRISRSSLPAEPAALRSLHPGYQLLSDAYADQAAEALAIVQHTALGLGLPLTSLEIEMGPSQFEAVFAATDALTAADNMVLFRNGVRQALRRAGYQASFATLPPFAASVASGWHLHHSLLNAAGDNAFLRDSPAPDSTPGDACHTLSDAGAHWLAGLLQHAAGLTALCVPSVAGYGRLKGALMAPQAPVWALDNRSAMLRVLGGAGEPSTRIENRLGEPMANPYLCLAGHVVAGLDGLRRGLQPGPATPATTAGNAPRLPATLGAALDALADDGVLTQGLGAQMLHAYLSVKRHELARFAAADDPAAWLAEEYFSRF